MTTSIRPPTLRQGELAPSAREYPTQPRRVATPSDAPERSFSDVLRDAARSMAQSQSRVDRAVRIGRRGPVDPGRLLALQADVYRFSQELELASKLVDKATSAVKQTLQSQQ